MDASPVKRLYKYYGILAEAAEQGEKILDHEDLYSHIIDARHGNSEEKRLAAQFIPKMIQHFPHLLDAAVSAQLDLCEDSDLVVRKQAVKEVSALCQAHPKCVKRVAFFVAQLLGAEDSGEGLLVRSTLVTLFNIEPAATLGGIFASIRDAGPKMRERCKTFLSNRFGSLNKTVVAKMRDTLLNELDICLENSNSHEIGRLAPLLPFAAPAGAEDSVIVKLLERQLEMEASRVTASVEEVRRVLVLTQLATPHFDKMSSTRFVSFYALHVVPLLKDVEGFETGSGEAAALLKQLAEMSHHCTEPLPEPELALTNIFRLLSNLLPRETEGPSATIHFTLVECLLLTLLQLIATNPSTYDSYDASLTELRSELRLLARFVVSYRRGVAALNKATANDHRIPTATIKCLDNLKMLCRRFFLDPPKLAVRPALSWAPSGAKQQRPPTVADNHHKKSDYHHHKVRGVQQLYTPPGGKYSRSFKRF